MIMNNNIIHIKIPFIERKLWIYVSDGGRTLFDKQIKALYPDWEGDIKADGMHYENYIFVENIENIEVLFHEISHFLDWLYTLLNCQYESEFKAHLMSYILVAILRNNVAEEER